MSGGSPKTLTAIGGLLALIIVDHVTWYAVRALFFVFLMAGPERMGLNLSWDAAYVFHDRAMFWSWLALPIMGCVACVLGARRTMLGCALLVPAACWWLASSNEGNVFTAMFLLGIAHAGVAVTIYVLAGRLVENARLRWALFCALSIAVSFGAFTGPLVGGFAGPDLRGALQTIALFSILGVAIVSALFFLSRDSQSVHEALRPVRIGELCLFSLAAVCYWGVFWIAMAWMGEARDSPAALALRSSTGLLASIALMLFLIVTYRKGWAWLTERAGVTAALTLLGLVSLLLPLAIAGPAAALSVVGLLLTFSMTEALLAGGLSAVSVLTRGRWAAAFVGIYMGVGMSGIRIAGMLEFSKPAWIGTIVLTLIVAAGVGFGLRALHRDAPLPG